MLMRILITSALTATLAACATPAPRADATASAAASASTTSSSATSASTPAPPANDELYATAWMQTSVEYDAVNRAIYTLARAPLDRALADKTWDALPPSERAATGVDAAGLPPAIILDIDETVLENSPFNAEMILNPIDPSLDAKAFRAEFDRRWSAWVKLAAAPRMAGVKAFLDYAASKDVEIFYLSNRACSPTDPKELCDEAPTCANLEAQHLPLKDCENNVILRYEQAPYLTDKEKGTRRIEVGKRYRVVMLFGDNLGDFVDGIYGDNTKRRALACAQPSWWGERWIALPNPSYGSWVDAIDAVASGQAFANQAERIAWGREHKRQALIAPSRAADLIGDCP